MKDRFVAVRDLVYRQMPNHLYHNFNHAIDVYNVATELAEAEGVDSYGVMVLQNAGLTHDAILIPGYSDNEEQTAKFVEARLPGLGYSSKETQDISNLIPPTKYPTNPEGLMQEIICDADTANVGRKDFFEKSHLVFTEMGLPREKWTEAQKGFLKGHQFYTDSAKRIYGPGKERNIQLLGGV